jgi:parvulin-like peptidyl-prolyl isomerase
VFSDPNRRQAEQIWYGSPNAYSAPASVSAAPPAPVEPLRPPAGMEAPGGYSPYQGPSATARIPSPQAPPYGAPFAPPPAQAAASPLNAYSTPPGRTPEWTGPPSNALPSYTPRIANLPAPAMTPNLGSLATPPVVNLPPQNSIAAPSTTNPVESTAPPPRVPGELFEAGQVMAVVGDEPILAGDMLGPVNLWLEANKSKIRPGDEDAFRKRLIEQALESEVQNKLLYLDFLRTIRSKGAGPEKLTEIHNKVFEQFDEKRLPDMLEKAGVASPAELDAKMREQGTSLIKHKRQFAEKVMGQEGLRSSEKINFEPIITHGQMLDYYYAHIKEYEIPAKVKWEHLMARFSKFPDKAAAYEAIRAMGTEVYLGGAPLWAVAKRSSHGVTASDGGQFEGTTKGSLKSKVLDEAIFSLPLNQLSPILEDSDGFHIVRVLERHEAGRTSFESTQAEIKEKLKKEHVDKQIATYLADLRKRTPVWTVFDEEKKQREQEEARRTSAFGGQTR